MNLKALVQDMKYSKFDESVDLAIKLGVDPRHAEENIRVTTPLPHGTGKSVKVLVLTEGAKEKEAQDAKKQREKLKKERDRRLKELEKEIDEMKQFVKETIKEPTTKRRNSITSFVEHLPIDEQNIPI